ncbi:MAG: hypothetical protein CMI16_12700 [Opitutaceae bacterium]|nr:hypothetical protein [Opitutaceae bacterium]|tara:strand:+ start:798 stop:1190 length:393 start_codon:yes stop_codon:yes gene_type:complete
MSTANIEWNVYRLGAVLFVILAPFAVLTAAVCCSCLRLRRQRTIFVCNFWFWSAVQAIAAGGLIAFWAHFVPCIWLACDLGPQDDGVLRGALWFGLWPVITFLLILPCFFGRDYGLLARDYELSYEQTHV